MKVLGMHGELLEGGDKSAPMQDFFFNNALMIELTDIDTCLEIIELREKHFDDPAMLKAKTPLRTDAVEDRRRQADGAPLAAKYQSCVNELLHAERIQARRAPRPYGRSCDDGEGIGRS